MDFPPVMRKLITNALLFVFYFTLLPSASAWFHWQPPQLHNHEQGLKLLFQAQPVGSNSDQVRAKKIPLSPLTITARAGQIFTVCSQQVRTDDDSTFLIESAPVGTKPYTLILSQDQTTLYFEKPYPCPVEVVKQQAYDYQGILYSRQDFSVFSQKEAHQKVESQDSELLFTGLPNPSSSGVLLSGGGGLDSDDDNSLKPPFQPPPAGQSDITLTLLPFLKLPPDWQNQLPGNHWFHWMFGVPDYNSDAILNIQMNGEPVARLPLHSWELQELAEDLTNSRQLLQKLAHKLNGRETFIQQLLDILATSNQTFLDEETRERIEQQLTDVLEQTDQTFSLELEWFSLKAAIIPDNAILKAHGDKDKDKKQKAGSGQSSGREGQAPQQSSGGQQSDSEQNSKQTPDEQEGAGHPSPSDDNGQTTNDLMAAQFYRLKAGDVSFTMEKSATPLKKKGMKKPEQITIIRESDDARFKLPEIVQYDPSPIASHLSEKSDVLDYLLRYGVPDSLRDYLRFASGQTLPYEELAIATPTIIAALAKRPHIVNLLKLSGQHTPLHDAVSLGLTTCTAKLLGLNYPVDEPLPKEGTLLHIAVEKQHNKIIQKLLSWKASPDVRRRSDGLSPFQLAIKNARVESAQLLSPYANKKIKTASGELPLQLIPPIDRENSQNQELLRRLVEPDNPNAPENFQQFIADIRAGNVTQVINFIKSGVNFNVYWDDKSPLHIAVESGHPETVEALLHYINPKEEQIKESSGLYRMLNGLTISKEEAPLHLAVNGVINARSSEESQHYLTIISSLLDNGVIIDIPRGSDGSTPLLLAARAGASDAFGLLKKEGAEINRTRTSDQMTPLHAAVECEDIKLVTSLLSAGADATALMCREEEDLYPLDIALEKDNAEMVKVVGRKSWFLFDYCKAGETDLVRHYLDAGVPASLERTGAYSLLYQAVRGGNYQLINLLVNKGANINKAFNNGMTPLHLAAEHGPLSVVTTLTHYDAEFRKNKSGQTPLDLALRNHQGPIARHLLGHYFSVESSSTSDRKSASRNKHPLIEAAIHGDGRLIQQLKNEGCINGEMPLDKEGNTPLHLAAWHKQAYIIPLLITAGIHKALNHKLQTPLSVAFSTNNAATILAFAPLMNASLFWAIRNRHVFHVQMILDSGVEFEPVEEITGNYPLHIAVQSGQDDSVRLLLNHKLPFSQTNTKNAKQRTPMDEALARLESQDASIDRKTYRSILKQLLEAEDGHTLFQAARDNKIGLIERLLNAGADINQTDRYGESALHKAAKRGYIEMIHKLKDRGATIDLRNSRSETPCQLARQNGHRDVARLLDDGFTCTLL